MGFVITRKLNFEKQMQNFGISTKANLFSFINKKINFVDQIFVSLNKND